MTSDTVVFQSFRTQNVPQWIARCMQTARDWATLRGFDYHFVDDRLFDYVPPHLRSKTQNKVILSDIARLLVSRELLQKGFKRTVWIDADVVIFDPQSWVLPTDSSYYLCHELWPNPVAGGVQFDFRANNAVFVFSAGNPFLDFYIDSCQRILETEKDFTQWMLGTRFLKAIVTAYPVPVLKNIGMLDLNMLEDLAKGTTRLLPLYMQAMGEPLVAANCCFSNTDASVHGFKLTEAVFAAVIDRCIATRGQIINQYLKNAPKFGGGAV
jgi:hypothetical protein